MLINSLYALRSSEVRSCVKVEVGNPSSDGFCGHKAALNIRAQGLCESRGGRPGLPSLISLRFLWTKATADTQQASARQCGHFQRKHWVSAYRRHYQRTSPLSAYRRHYQRTVATISVPSPLSAYVATISVPSPLSAYRRHYQRTVATISVPSPLSAYVATISVPSPLSAYRRHYQRTVATINHDKGTN